MYCYLHIPKTGGTSLRALMRDRFGGQLLETDAAGMFDFLPYVKGFRCVAGHLPLFILGLENVDRTIFTMIRKPYDRVLSFMNHVLGEPAHVAYPFFMAGLMTDRDFLHTPLLKFQIFNLQTRMLGIIPSEALRDRARAGDLRGFQACMATYRETKLEEHHLEQAMENLRRLRLGVLDFFPFAITQTFRDISGDRDLSSVPRLSTYPPRVKITDEERELIEKGNQYDSALHRFARNLFLERTALEIMRRGDVVDLPGAPAPFEGMYSADQYRGGLLRWTTDQALMRVCVPPNIERCRVRIESWILESVRCDDLAFVKIGDQLVTKSRREGETLIHEGTCETKVFGSVRELEIRIDSPSSGNDSRKLGLPLRSVRIEST